MIGNNTTVIHRNKLSTTILICPVCGSGELLKNREGLFCRNNNCLHFNKTFLFVNEKPVLIDFDKSLISESLFEGNAGKSIVPRREANFGKYIRKVFQGESPATKTNILELIGLMNKIEEPKILIVGGGEIGSGLNEFYEVFKENIVSFDIYDSTKIDFIGDAHLIPVRSEYFDLVIIQAVLEHVLNPVQVVSEITRVLKNGGHVYAETPFMQQVHEGPFDFTRFTESGHRYLFKDYDVTSSGYISGAGSSLIWSLNYFFSGLFRTRNAGKIIRVFFFWLRFFDRIIPDTYNIDAACGVFFMGTKSLSAIRDKQIIAYYKGNQTSIS